VEVERGEDIYKSAAIMIKGRRTLLTRSRGKKTFVSPGGKLERGETPAAALIRELIEEVGIAVDEAQLKHFGTYYAPAAEQERLLLRMDVFVVSHWKGDCRAGREIEELKWVSADLEPGLLVGSIFRHEILPRLKADGLVD